MKKKQRPTFVYVALTEDDPPNMAGLSFYRSCLQQNLLHQKMQLVPVGKPMKAKKHYGPTE